jgi:hypothetical protein
MSPSDVRSLEDREIVELLAGLEPSSQKAMQWLAAIVSDDVAYEGVRELRRRFGREPSAPELESDRMPSARTVAIDRQRWNTFFFRRRMALVEAGPLMEPPRSTAWASVMGSRGRAGLYALDDLACALGIHVNELISEVGTDEELSRLSA